MASVNFCQQTLYMDVLCVARYLNYTLAGVGNSLFVYTNQDLQLSEKIFVGERIHCIYVKDDLILLKGGRQLSLVTIEDDSNAIKCKVNSRVQCSDWIQDVIMLNKRIIGLVTAHNIFEVWDLECEKLSNVIPSTEKCILYSCKIIGDSLKDIIVFAGTVFGDILIWGPYMDGEQLILQQFRGHNGAVFSIEVKPIERIISTTSDDRTLKIWSVNSETPLIYPKSWRDSKIQLIHTLFGHTARVWRSLVISDYLLTVGEDSKLIIWSKDGRMLKTFSIHQESGIRALDYSENTNAITTGGEDGGINMFSLKYLIAEAEATNILNFDQNFSTRVCFTKNGFVHTLNGGCVFVSKETKKEEIIYKDEKFSTYCLMEVSLLGDYISLGSIKGVLVIIDVVAREVIFEEQILNGRIYSIHWLDDYLLTCGPNGRLGLWEFRNKLLKNIKEMELPNCKERWTTCGVIQKESLIVGDRMGNVYCFNLNGTRDPIYSFRKIHSYLGVTDIVKDDNSVLSIGRDGTVKTFTGNLTHSMTYKLPMEWPWKIIKHNEDTLILGFHSVSFVVWSMKNREIIARHDCGGGHRSCDYKLNQNKLSFLYVKEKKLFTIDLILDGINRIRKGFHGKEINCLKILQTDPMIIITGSEDTTLRISKLGKSEVEEIVVLKTHVSSVRAVVSCHVDSNELLILSAGGKGQMVIWTFDLRTLKCKELVNHNLRRETRNWKSSKPDFDPDTRFMCLDAIKLGNDFLIASGCSDCRLRMFLYGQDFKELSCIPYTHCILNIGFVRFESMVLIASMGTDGRVVFWNATDYSNVVRLKVFDCHQSGINSFQFEEETPGKFILATGGDDNMISIAIVENSEGKMSLSQIWKKNETHSCQITGIKIMKNFLITTSIDQRITIWKWFLREGQFQAEFLNQYMTAVPDIQGMDTTWLDCRTILVAVHGKGMEILRVDINETSHDKDSLIHQDHGVVIHNIKI